MTYSDGTIDRIEATFKELADEVNRTSASTRNGWVFFLALQAYFFVALAGITHRDLLLDTARLFDGGIDRLSGRPASMFGRNLVVTDTDLVKDGAFDEGESSINLRLRDLRYGTFDRSDMHQADFTGANLASASLREVNLVETKAEQANFRGADLWAAQLFPFRQTGRPVSPIDLRGADLRGANLANANLQGAKLDGALLEGTNLQGASLEPAVKAEATRQGAKF